MGTPKACFVCYKPTTTVLATINTVDFIYTCDNHLTDPGFASQVGESQDGVGSGAKKLGLSAEEIAKVKEEWEERQRRKKEKEKEKEQGKEKEKSNNSSKEDIAKNSAPSQSPPPAAATPSTPSTPSHQRYTLHRDIFAIRLAEHRKRKQIAQAKALLPRLPGAPRGPLPSY